jgi:hypothetical protein
VEENRRRSLAELADVVQRGSPSRHGRRPDAIAASLAPASTSTGGRILIVVGITVTVVPALLVIVEALSEVHPRSPDGRQPSPAQAAATDEDWRLRYPINAYNLVSDYEANEVSADLQYKGHVIAVRGTVLGIHKDLSDRPYVSIGDNGTRVRGVSCYFRDADVERLSKLTKGDTLVIAGKCDGLMWDVRLVGC